MKTQTTLKKLEEIPQEIQECIAKKFPGVALETLKIRYYTHVRDVGQDFFREIVVASCNRPDAAQFLEPFISFECLGEALVLEHDELVVFAPDATETGPLWVITQQ